MLFVSIFVLLTGIILLVDDIIDSFCDNNPGPPLKNWLRLAASVFKTNNNAITKDRYITVWRSYSKEVGLARFKIKHYSFTFTDIIRRRLIHFRELFLNILLQLQLQKC